MRKLALQDSLIIVIIFSFWQTRPLKMALRLRHKVAVLFIDLNDFKLINDRFGHKGGDEVLPEIGLRLRRLIRQSAKLGSDEFAVLLADIPSHNDIDRAFQAIDRELNKSLILQNGAQVCLYASIVTAVFPDEGADIDVLLEVADSRMYKAKFQRKQGFKE
jgi:diguanylate cyclase (GGDEF)-like protein